tara:strand:- start:425 stop:634 length:210 start_codon:yes stop_codon:yes gene_type:complete
MGFPTERKLPDLSKDLIDALDARFPVRMADPKDSEREIWIKVGQRNVVEFIKDVYEEQHTTILSPSTKV